jgi:hypothetical protein
VSDVFRSTLRVTTESLASRQQVFEYYSIIDYLLLTKNRLNPENSIPFGFAGRKASPVISAAIEESRQSGSARQPQPRRQHLQCHP